MTHPLHRLRLLGAALIAALIATAIVVLPGQSASAADALSESFKGTTASGWAMSGGACLTKIPTGTTGTCGTNRNNAPLVTLTDGFLQLNDDRPGLAGSSLYNTAITAPTGIDVMFDQYQMSPLTLAVAGEGIGFYLTDGSGALTSAGSAGSALGYSPGTAAGSSGVMGGYLGIGLDVQGNYSLPSHGPGCTGTTGTPTSTGSAGPGKQANRIVARGPFTGTGTTTGYCYLGSATADLQTPTGLLLPILGTVDPTNPPVGAGRTIRVTVGTGATPIVTVYYGASAGMTASALTQSLSFTMPKAAPASYKMGFTGTTTVSGGGLAGLSSIEDTHLIRNLVVKPLNSLTVSAQVNPTPTPAASYAQGATVPYLYTVTNTGGASVSSVSVTDTLGDAISCAATALAAGASTTCTANHVVTPTEATAATTLAMTATATATLTTATTPATTTVSATSTVVTVAITTPARTLSLSKVGALVDANGNAKADIGEKITYTFTATNTGNVTANNVVVADPKVTGISPASATLTPGASQVFTSTQYTVTAADINAGTPITNTATVTATGFTSATSTVNTPINYAPALTLTKNGALNGTSAVGSTISYSFTLANTGTTTLTSVGITDPLAPVAITWPGGYTVGTLTTGQSVTATATYTITQADLDAGQRVNTATASGTAPNASVVTSTASKTVALTRSPNLTFTKTANPTVVKAAGAVITYTFTATNTGNTTLSSVSIADPHTGLSAIAYSWPGTAGTLAPNAVVTATATYTSTAADVTAGSIPNTATITATPAGGTAITRTASVTVPVVPDPVADSATVAQGDIVVINVLTNDGVAATGATFSRAQLSAAPTVIGGAATPAPATPIYGSVSCADSGANRGQCSYRSVDYFVGTDVFDYALSGAYGTWNVRVTVTVTAKNHAPVARADRLVATTGGAAIGVDPLANDTDPDGTTPTVQSISVPGGIHGAFACPSTCSFTPAADGWTGSVSIGYTIVDAGGLTASSTITVFVDPAPIVRQGFTDRRANSAAVGLGAWASTTTASSPAGTCVAGRPSTTVSWTAVSGATNYMLERRIATTGTWVTVAVLGAVTTFTDDRLGEGRSYQWRVRPDLQRWAGVVSAASTASAQPAVATAMGC
ncbi:DUF11 domain-containing protein [Microbacteriaceae bacterium VKM Ac-2855]|nr:DUF11 domain-containing protein [Microbacteriaceae bacterium VKM Ac-2855]